MHQLEQRMSFLEGVYEQVNQRLSSIDAHLDSLDRKFTGETGRLDTKIDHSFAILNEKIEHVDEKIDRRFMWSTGIMLCGFLTTILTVVFRHEAIRRD